MHSNHTSGKPFVSEYALVGAWTLAVLLFAYAALQTYRTIAPVSIEPLFGAAPLGLLAMYVGAILFILSWTILPRRSSRRLRPLFAVGIFSCTFAFSHAMDFNAYKEFAVALVFVAASFYGLTVVLRYLSHLRSSHRPTQVAGA
jgi:hypothetical protein